MAMDYKSGIYFFNPFYFLQKLFPIDHISILYMYNQSWLICHSFNVYNRITVLVVRFEELGM